MLPVTIEGVRRNFIVSANLMYSVTLIDESRQRIFVFGVERHEAMAIVAALHDLAQLRPQTVDLMVDTLKQLGHTLEEARIEKFSMLPPLYHLCSCTLRWRNGGNGEAAQEQTLHARPGDILALALHMKAPIFVSDEFAKQMGVPLAEGETPELLFAKYLLRQEGITLPEGKKLRLGFSGTPLRDALVKEFKAALQGKAPPFPEEDMQQRKKEYLTFLLGEEAQVR
ncbi:MAG TPA: bifunctional nuclease domain-containing protein [Ktedonosporobacter sp.]|nr:bifunctional nuclease domain-containing protein [Ktedonosporobacter sp.]